MRVIRGLFHEHKLNETVLNSVGDADDEVGDAQCGDPVLENRETERRVERVGRHIELLIACGQTANHLFSLLGAKISIKNHQIKKNAKIKVPK